MNSVGIKKPNVRSMVDGLNKRVKKQSKIIESLNMKVAELEFKVRKGQKRKKKRTDFTSFSPKTKHFLSEQKTTKLTDYKSSGSSMINDSEDM